MITIIDNKKRHNVGTVKILGHLTIDVTNLNPMPMKWKIVRIHLTDTLIIEKKRKTYVVDAVMTGPLVINVRTIRQYSAKASMERKCKSLLKRPHPIIISTPSQNEEQHQENT